MAAVLGGGVVSTALADGSVVSHPADHGPQLAATMQVSGKVAETKAALRDVWVGHIFWVRGVVFATFAKNATAAKVAEAGVVADAKQIAGAIEPFYGEEASDKLFTLLAGHYGSVKEYLEATVEKDSKAQSAATDHLTANAGEIAGFLSGANPNLPKDTLEELLMAHGAHHLEQIQEVQTGEYGKEAETWAAMKGHIYLISDALADALAKQFPDKF
jgi:hypothetical protein